MTAAAVGRLTPAHPYGHAMQARHRPGLVVVVTVGKASPWFVDVEDTGLRQYGTVYGTGRDETGQGGAGQDSIWGRTEWDGCGFGGI